MTTRKTSGPRPPAPVVARKKPSPKRELSSWEKIIARSERITDEELAFHPRDGAANLDHYLYGTPKQDPD